MDSSKYSDNSTRPKGHFSLLSWNIHNLSQAGTGSKTDDAEFNQIIEQASIFCLQETKGAVTLQNYRCFNSLRDNTRSGGVCIGVHRSMEDHVTPIAVECPDIQALKISKVNGDSDQNLLIVNVYDPPDNSCVSNKRRAMNSLSVLEQLTELLTNQ